MPRLTNLCLLAGATRQARVSAVEQLQEDTIMLQIYIEQYKEAIARSDTKTANRIERELASLGMDKSTLRLLANSLNKGSHHDCI